MGSQPRQSITYGIAPTKVAVETKAAIDAGYKIIVHQGGTRSGKTTGIQDLLIGTAYGSAKQKSISTCSISLPHLKKGAMRDWKMLMESKGSYNPNMHNMTDLVYNYPTGSYMEFFSVDDPKRVRGPGRDILHINEANLLSLETWRQLVMRTRELIILDFNPDEEFHWIYDEVIPRNDCKFIQTTYKDNPFLSKSQREEIERLRDVDENFWKIYGLGERGTSQNTVYQGFKLFEHWIPEDYCFGLDFGFTHPNALVKVGLEENNLYFEQKLYLSQLTSSKLIEEIQPIVGQKYVHCDSARPEIIQDLQNAGINAYPTNKYEGSVKDGIDFIRGHNIFVHRESIDFQKEMRAYKWKVKPNGQTVDEPVKAFDDLMDAGRYGAISLKNQAIPMFTTHS